MKSIYDSIEDKTIYAKNIVEISKATGVEASKLSRLLSNWYHSVANRYTVSKEDCFIIERIHDKKEIICADNKTFFAHVGEDYNESTSKFIYALRIGQQKSFSFKGIFYKLKRDSRPFEKRKEIFPKDHQKNDCPIKILNRKIAERLRCRLRDAIKRNANGKAKPTLDYLGCSISEFTNWLESQFLEGMNWGNYGVWGWHIDHIRPCNTFDLTKEEEIFKCFNYLNMRPLWAYDNIRRPDDGSDILVPPLPAVAPFREKSSIGAAMG